MYKKAKVVQEGEFIHFKNENDNILATTNPDLWNATPLRVGSKSLAGIKVAKIDINFIEAYAKAEGKITEVLLEYEHHFEDSGQGGYDYHSLKLRNNGSVIIHPVQPTEKDILLIIKEESEAAGVRKYTCINGFGYSQFERNIAERVYKLFKK